VVSLSVTAIRFVVNQACQFNHFSRLETLDILWLTQLHKYLCQNHDN